MLDSLTENLGDKIKNFAKIVLIIEGIGTIISGLILMFAVNFLLGLVILVGGLIACVIMFWFVYAFGEIAEATEYTRYKVYEIQREIETLKAEPKPEPVTMTRTKSGARASASVAVGNWTCTCGRVNASYVSSCVCGLTKHEAKQKLAEESK